MYGRSGFSPGEERVTRNASGNPMRHGGDFSPRRTRLFAGVVAVVLLMPALLLLGWAEAATPVLHAAVAELRDPYERHKNGPPLTHVTHKVRLDWLAKWLASPRSHDRRARMPDLDLEDDEIQAVIAYLLAIGGETPPPVEWEPVLLKSSDDLTDRDWGSIDSLYDNGSRTWRRSRCTICHGGQENEGFVNLRVGVNLGNVQAKVRRDWLYRWIRNPKEYFPNTLMPTYRFSDTEVRGLVEYLLRDPGFLLDFDVVEQGDTPRSDFADPELAATGKRVIVLSRCVLCHDIEGIDEILPPPPPVQPPTGEFARLAEEIKCLTCHEIAGKGGNYAPRLTIAGSKLKKNWILSFVQAPDVIRPLLQQMPRFNLSADEAAVVVAFVGEHLRSEVVDGISIQFDPLDAVRIREGEAIFRQRGCISCHMVGATGGGVGPNLSRVGDRLTPEHMVYHLRDPQTANAFSVEPNYELSDTEIRNLVHFLARKSTGKP